MEARSIEIEKLIAAQLKIQKGLNNMLQVATGTQKKVCVFVFFFAFFTVLDDHSF